jgi:predicted DNA-binding transcriptional regulator AlpA
MLAVLRIGRLRDWTGFLTIARPRDSGEKLRLPAAISAEGLDAAHAFVRRVMVTSRNPIATADAKMTAAPIEAGASASVEFLRLPDVTRRYGLKRGHVYSLIADGLIKSVCLRRPGCKTGVRLVHVASLREYLHKRLA